MFLGHVLSRVDDKHLSDFHFETYVIHMQVTDPNPLIPFLVGTVSGLTEEPVTKMETGPICLDPSICNCVSSKDTALTKLVALVVMYI